VGSVHGFSVGQVISDAYSLPAGTTISPFTLTTIPISAPATATQGYSSLCVAGGTPQCLFTANHGTSESSQILLRPSISAINTRITITGTLYGSNDIITSFPKVNFAAGKPGAGYSVYFQLNGCRHGLFTSAGLANNGSGKHSSTDAVNPYPKLIAGKNYIFQTIYLKTGVQNASVTVSIFDRASGNLIWTASDAVIIGTGTNNMNAAMTCGIGTGSHASGEGQGAIESVSIDCAPDSLLSFPYPSGSISIRAGVTDRIELYSATATWPVGVWSNDGSGTLPQIFTLSGGTGASLTTIKVFPQFEGAQIGQKAILVINSGYATDTLTVTDTTQSGANQVNIPVSNTGSGILSSDRPTALSSSSPNEVDLRVWPTAGGDGNYSYTVYRSKTASFIPPAQGTPCSGMFSYEDSTNTSLIFTFSPPGGDIGVYFYKVVNSDQSGDTSGGSASWCTDYAGYTFPSVRYGNGISASIVSFGDSKTGPYYTATDMIAAGCASSLTIAAEGVGGTFYSNWDPSLPNNYFNVTNINNQTPFQTGKAAIVYYNADLVTLFLGTNDSIDNHTSAQMSTMYSNLAKAIATLPLPHPTSIPQMPRLVINYPDVDILNGDTACTWIVAYADAIDSLAETGAILMGDKRATVCMVEDAPFVYDSTVLHWTDMGKSRMSMAWADAYISLLTFTLQPL
jgi:lysophospholipase L1-like esterase